MRGFWFSLAATAGGLLVGLAFVFAASDGPTGSAERPQVATNSLSSPAHVADDSTSSVRAFDFSQVLYPAEWSKAPRVSGGYYFFPASVASLEELDGWTDGIARVRFRAVDRSIVLFDERRPASADDVIEFRNAGKSISEGQLIGPAGNVITIFDAEVSWIGGQTELAKVVMSGGLADGILYDLEDIPLPMAEIEYLLMLREHEYGLVAESVQFEIEATGTLRAINFPASPIAHLLSGTNVAEVGERASRLIDGE